ncbi:hypothetical protein P4O66_017564, partial [Electrophorus voltai]
GSPCFCVPVSSDVSPSTSIPPLVEGQVRCFLRATMGRVVWAAGRPPPVTLVRLRWWGEAAGGTLFRPRDGALAPHRDVKDTARFPVRCGPKQFTSYLTDMGLLVLDVLTKPDHLPIARVQIAGIARLSLSHSINGFFTLVSPTSEKLGKLQVTLALEPLTETYDGSSSVPTTDMSTEVPESVPGLRPPALSLCAPSSAGRESVGNSSSSTPRFLSSFSFWLICFVHFTKIIKKGKDHLYFQGRGNVPFTRKAAGRPDDQQNILPAPTAAVVGPSTPGPDASLDLLSVLLERGSKLSNAMVISALRSDIGSDMALKDTPFPLPRDNAGAALLSPPMPSSGRLLQDILRSDLQSSSQDPGLTGSECMAHMHSSAVDLLLGSVSGSVLPVWDGESSPPGLFSACSSLLLDSDFSDPQYDQSLLENLFYRAPSDSCLSPTEDESHCKHSSDKKNRSVHLHQQSWSLILGDERPVENSGQCAGPEDSFPELSVDRVALLGRIRLARVSILQLALPTNTTGTPRMLSKRGRPPLPLTTKKCSYFVEYFFPLPSSDKNEPGSSVPADVTRVVSSKVVEGALNFRQRSVFPVHFDGPTIKRWWDTNLPFKIYCRQSFQKKPVPIGMAEFPLRCVLQSDELTITTVLPVHTLEDSPSKQDTGPLKVSFELVEDKKGFSSKSRLRKVAGGAGASPRRTLSQEADVSAGPWDGEHTGGFLSLREEEYRTDSSRRATPPNHTIQMSRSRSASPRSGAPDPRPTQEEQSDVLLHVLLMVPDGKDFVCSPMQPNVYLNCKLFGSEECTRSMVSWGQTQPTFSLVQVAPLTLTSKLLERMRNNVMVIEVWLRTSRSDEDKLLGLVKLPLHQFYMSFRDPKVSQLLLQAEYPVVAVDGYVPVVDIFTGDARGSLRVCLAMGHAQQVVALQRGRDEEMGSGAQPPRPTHLLDQSPAADRKVRPAGVCKTAVAPTAGEVVADVLMEHVFVVRVEKVKGLTPLQSTVWGEADCYTQYSFPTQEVEAMEHINPHTVESTLDLKPYRTATTLCVPDPVFGHCETHVLLASPGVPVQRLLLSSLASQGLANGGGIQFEVWCRYYYPNVREQLAARGTLPMAKLCAMVTLQGRSQATGTFQGQSPAEAQLFSLPLIPRTDRPSKIQPQPSAGLLEVSVQYRSRPVRMSGVRSGVSPCVVYLLVGLHRAMGLQAAARWVTGPAPFTPRHAPDTPQPSPVTNTSPNGKTEVLLYVTVLSLMTFWGGYFRVYVPQFRRLALILFPSVPSALGLPYFSEVGVNALVSVQLSFLLAQESQSTRVVARTFCPEFEYHAEFCCPLLIQREGGESVSLAELLQEATAVFTVYHRDTRKGVPWRSRDGVLGLARVGLADLLHKRTGEQGRDEGVHLGPLNSSQQHFPSPGVSGWFALSPPPGLGAGCSLTPVGGLELSINFAQCADRERLLRSAQLLGWEVPKPGEEEEDEGDGDASSERHRLLVLSVSVPRAWVPVHCLLLPGHSEVQRSTYCYYRYKLYEQEACCSALRRPALEQGRATLAFPVAHILELRETQPLRWYLREERLEVQLWVSFGKQKRVRPHDSDRLVGSAFINLSALAAVKDKQTISGVYPLFKRSAADMGGAALRVHIAATTDSAPYTALPTSQEEVEHLSNSGEEEEDREPSSGMSRQSRTSSSVQGRPDRRSAVVQASHDTELPDDKSFTATVSVERAMHLSLRGCPLAERGDVLPSCRVSYATADAPGVVTTAVVRDSGCPVWDHQQDCRSDPSLRSGLYRSHAWVAANCSLFFVCCRLSKELLVDPQQLLVFKVWHRGDVERVIGFASVDLSPLLSGFQSVCGWYNITDFSGQCQGQLKVAVSPLVGVQQLRPQRQAACEISAPDASTLFSALPLCYQTTGMYRSFPSHKISSSSEHLRLLSARSAVTDHRDEHVDSVHCFHPAVQGAGSSSLAPSAGDTQHSTSALISALRKNLTELDDIQRYFSRKLSTPEFSGEAEQGRQPGQEKHGGPAYCPQTLEGDAQSVMKGVREHQSEAASSNTVRDQTPPAGQTEVCLFSAEGHLTPVESESSKTETCSQKDLETRLENISTLISPDPEESSLSSIPEDLHEDQCSTGGGDGENEEEQDEEFEEMLIEPRPLNEVTSVTDRTSPWTSVLSDPDLGSLESVEVVGQHGCGSSLPQEKQRDTAMAMSPAPSQPLTSELTDADLSDGFGSVAECACVSPGKGHSDEEEKVTVGLREEHSDEEETISVSLREEHSDEEEKVTVGLREEHSDEEEMLSVGLREEHSDEEEMLSVGLREEHSDEEEKVTVGLREEHSDEEEKVTVGLREDSTQGIQQTLYHTQQDSTSGSEDESQLPPSTGPSTTACAVDRYETHTKLCDAVEIPNFFLPSHHLEASMRALRLAPVFPSVSSGPGTVKSEGTYRRAFHPKTRIPPSSANGEETKRIAKIFATNFTEQS